jgi:hypothetical protein
MPKKTQTDTIAEIEQAQEQLRENIEASKQLVEKTQKLLRKAKERAD